MQDVADLRVRVQARRSDTDSGVLGTIARVRLPPRPLAQQMPLGQAVPLFMCPATGQDAREASAAELERPYLRVPPAMRVAALGHYTASQLGLLPGEAVELACGGKVLAGTATLGETLDALHAQGGSDGLVEYGVAGSGAESLMLVLQFRALPHAEAATSTGGSLDAGMSRPASGREDRAAAVDRAAMELDPGADDRLTIERTAGMPATTAGADASLQGQSQTSLRL